MSWNDVGDWLKQNGGKSAALVGSLLTGNLPSAVAMGVSLVASATGTDDPANALNTLQSDPDTHVHLQELAYKEQDSIRKHLEEMTRLDLEDKQKSHEQTQMTIRNGDSQESKIRWVRPIYAGIALIASIVYAFYKDSPNEFVFATLISLPFAYFGLREVGKNIGLFKSK